jgi:metal-sulfur cluster biosynthetic enzyme
MSSDADTGREEPVHDREDPAYDRPEPDEDATACQYTEYDTGESDVSDLDGHDADVQERDRVYRESVEDEVPATGHGAEGLERRVWDALYGVEDPEMPVSVVDLGLVYDLAVDEAGETATVLMTLTYTGCPAREMLLEDVEDAVETVDGVEDASVELVWSPPWEVGLVTEQGKEALREFGLSI